jgi:adenine-specific DNA-methyltransferase
MMTEEKLKQMEKDGKLYWNENKRPNRKVFLDEYKGQPIENIWTDIFVINPMASERLNFGTQKPEALLSRIIATSTNEGDLVADFFVGSGTTAVVAEQLKRKWITADVSKVAIHLTRNRLINLSDRLKGNMNATMPLTEVAPFILQNLGNYQRHLIYLNGFNIKKACALIMKLYGAIQREDIIDLGLKIDRKDTIVFVSYPDRQLTAKLVFEKLDVVEELDNGIYKKMVVLAWDYELNYDQNLSILKNVHKNQIEIESKLIPTEIYTYLKKVDASNEEQINQLRNKIHFYDKPYLRLKKPKIIKDLGSEAIVRVEIDRYNILDFPMKDQAEETKLLKACKNNFSILIDYYSVDWDYDGQMFRSQTQVMAGFGKSRSVVKKFVEQKLRKGKKYNIVTRLVDIFGNDSEARTEIDLN